jgi:hypothetical protein
MVKFEPGSKLIFISKEKEESVLQNEYLLKCIFFATNGNLRSLRNLFQKLVDPALDGEEINTAKFASAWTPSMNNKLKFNPFEKSNARKMSNLIKKAA